MILVETFYAHNELRNFSYLIAEKATGKCWVIDPYDSDPIIKYIKKNGLYPAGILNTHFHWDHIRGNGPLLSEFQTEAVKAYDQTAVALDERNILRTVAAPGHTSDHKAFVWEASGTAFALFSGDTLFNSGVGNCRGGGNVDDLFETTRKLIQHLPEKTLLYPGHDYRLRNLQFALSVEPENKSVREEISKLENCETYELPPANLAYEREVNPFLRLQSEELKQNILHGQAADERELFKRLRTLRDNW